MGALIDSTDKQIELKNEITYQERLLMELKYKCCKCQEELNMNSKYILSLQSKNKINNKHHNKLVEKLKNAETELEQLENLILKQDELKTITPPEYESIIEQTKNQLNIRATDLKKEIKDLKKEIKYCEDEPLRNIECMKSTNECLEKEIENLKYNIEQASKDISNLKLQLKKLCTETI